MPCDKLPAMPVYVGDWFKDTGLQMCSLAARGLWFELCLRMWECEERGLLATGKEAWSDQKVAALIAGSEDETLACLDELLRAGVASRNKNGAIYSRRLVRDEKLRQIRKTAGSKGGFATAKRIAKDTAKGVAKRVANSETDTEYEYENKTRKTKTGKSAPKVRARCLIWDALEAVFYPSGIAPGQRKHVGALVRDFKAKGATPEEIHKRVERYKRAWPDHACTANALMEHWDEFGPQARPDWMPEPKKGVGEW